MSYLIDRDTNERIREATPQEEQASQAASKLDGGAGIITVADQGERRCYVHCETKAYDVTYTQTFTVRVFAESSEEAQALFDAGDFEDYAGTENVESTDVVSVTEVTE